MDRLSVKKKEEISGFSLQKGEKSVAFAGVFTDSSVAARHALCRKPPPIAPIPQLPLT